MFSDMSYALEVPWNAMKIVMVHNADLAIVDSSHGHEVTSVVCHFFQCLATGMAYFNRGSTRALTCEPVVLQSEVRELEQSKNLISNTSNIRQQVFRGLRDINHI